MHTFMHSMKTVSNCFFEQETFGGNYSMSYMIHDLAGGFRASFPNLRASVALQSTVYLLKLHLAVNDKKNYGELFHSCCTVPVRSVESIFHQRTASF